MVSAQKKLFNSQENKVVSYQKLIFHTNTKKTTGRQGVKVEITLKMIFLKY